MTECSGYGFFVISVWILPKIQENDIAHWVIYDGDTFRSQRAKGVNLDWSWGQNGPQGTIGKII